MSDERFTLDTNVLFYHVDLDAGPRHDIALEILDLAALRDCWLTLQSVSEFYTAVTRKKVMPPARAAEIANAWMDLFPSVAASATAVRGAVETAQAGRASYWDALLVLTAAEAGCTAVLTEDLADGSVLHGVRVINPFQGKGLSAAAARVLRAD